jgi:hypothetical protein
VSLPGCACQAKISLSTASNDPFYDRSDAATARLLVLPQSGPVSAPSLSGTEVAPPLIPSKGVTTSTFTLDAQWSYNPGSPLTSFLWQYEQSFTTVCSVAATSSLQLCCDDKRAWHGVVSCHVAVCYGCVAGSTEADRRCCPYR